MSTKDIFEAFLREHLDAQVCDGLFAYNFYRGGIYDSVFGTARSMQLSEDILVLMEQFLSSLSREEMLQYINKTDGYGISILFSANVSLINFLIKAGANIDLQEPCQNDTPLLEICWRLHEQQSEEKIKLLLDNGANVNAINKSHITPLINCCRSIKSYDAHVEEILETLIFHGADVSIEFTGKTAYEWIDNKDLLPERLQQLLQGKIKMNSTKRALK